MSIVYSTMKRYGGMIDIESEVGKGSTLSLQFPMTTKTVKTVNPERTPEQDVKGKDLHILVIDDEDNVRVFLDKYLSKQGHKVKTVDNGADAIELAKREEFDLVLSDLVMPNTSGYDVVSTLNALEKKPKIGIITGWGEKLKPIEEGMLKVDFILKKPFVFSELAKHINDVIGVG